MTAPSELSPILSVAGCKVLNMTTRTAPVTAEQLHTLFRKHYPERTPETLSVNADVITETHPQMASLMMRIDAAGTDKAGRATAIEFIGGMLDHTSVIKEYRKENRLATPDEIRAKAIYLWDDVDTKNNLMRAWALTNAAQETGTPMEEFQNSKRETMCERFHERHIASHLHAPNYDYGNFWHDSFYADEYWRGLAVFCIIGYWSDVDSGYKFILWAGQQDDLIAVTEIAEERNTIDPETIAALLEYRGVISPAVFEGVL